MKYYLIGIKGAGMSALGLILNDLGFVTRDSMIIYNKYNHYLQNSYMYL